MTDFALTEEILAGCFKVHTAMGPGLLESVYKAVLAHELRDQGLLVETEVPVPVVYGEVKLDIGFRLDLLVEKRVILEIKSVDALHPLHKKQLINYLKLTKLRVGLLLNFNTMSLRDQITRIANDHQ